jgi:glutathione synthase/RimK-type ligase-like ATP-grasp enzyme
VILILSNAVDDGHVPAVAAELSRRGEEHRLFDPSTYPSSSVATVRSTRRGLQQLLLWNEFELDLSDVKSVWYRRPGDFDLSDQLLPGEQKWLHSECSHLFRAMWNGMHSLWISDPSAIRAASLKLIQLKVAIEMGFDVPQFVVTNEVDTAREFISSCHDGAVLKVLADPVLLGQHGVGMFFTHLVSRGDLDKIDSVRFGPTFLQAFVEKSMDVRVTVFGEKLFAIGIQTAGVEIARIDFRRAHAYDLPHVEIVLPENINTLCIELVKRLGLNFGAIDLLLTPDGRYVFLEINPNGQWYWLEWMTGVPMTKSLCDMLSKGREG